MNGLCGFWRVGGLDKILGRGKGPAQVRGVRKIRQEEEQAKASSVQLRAMSQNSYEEEQRQSGSLGREPPWVGVLVG